MKMTVGSGKGKYDDLEIDLLFEAMFRQHGYDFRNYAPESARRRVNHHIKINNIGSISDLQHHIIYDESAADALLKDLSINVTEMFRDPLFFKALRKQTEMDYNNEPHIKIWHAGCSSGEEAYSMAILLRELGYLNKSQLFATDFNNKIIEQAKQGVITIKNMKSHIQNYHKSGGEYEFSDYYLSSDKHAIFDQSLKKRILFSHHNLTGDGVFGEMDIIICRNVLIYFNAELQERVFKLFFDSLKKGGLLCLGSHETIRISKLSKKFETVSNKFKIYKKNSDT